MCGPLSSLPLHLLGSNNSDRHGPQSGFGVGRLVESGRLTTACSGRRTAVTHLRVPSSRSKCSSGRNGTRAHPEQPAQSCQGPQAFAAATPGEQRVPCSACSQVHREERRGRILSSPRPTLGHTEKRLEVLRSQEAKWDNRGWEMCSCSSSLLSVVV